MQITAYVTTGISVVSCAVINFSVCTELTMTMLSHMLGKQQINIILPEN